MSLATRFRQFKLAHFAQPAHDRMLLRDIKTAGWSNILQFGLGDGERPLRLIDVAQMDGPLPELRFTGIDLFEANTANSGGLCFKTAYQLFRSRGIRVQLVPGDAGTAIARIANSLSGIDLVLISADQDEISLDRAWFYLPRVMASHCQVFREQLSDGAGVWRPITGTELQSLAGSWKKRRAA